MASPYGGPELMEPGNPDNQQPCAVYAAQQEEEQHELSYIMAFSDPHPISLVCSCGRKYRVVGP